MVLALAVAVTTGGGGADPWTKNPPDEAAAPDNWTVEAWIDSVCNDWDVIAPETVAVSRSGVTSVGQMVVASAGRRMATSATSAITTVKMISHNLAHDMVKSLDEDEDEEAAAAVLGPLECGEGGGGGGWFIIGGLFHAECWQDSRHNTWINVCVK